MADFIPRRDSSLLQWARTFSTKLASDPESFGISIEQSDQLLQSVAAFADAFALTRSGATRTPIAIENKNTSRAEMKSIARTLARIIQANPAVTSAQKISLGLSVRPEYPISGGIPDRPPVMTIGREIKNGKVRIGMSDPEHASKSKPKGIVGAMLFYHVGEVVPEKLSDWKFLRNVTLTDSMIELPKGYAMGVKIWFTGAWLDTLLNVGPCSNAVFTYYAQPIIQKSDTIRAQAA